MRSRLPPSCDSMMRDEVAGRQLGDGRQALGDEFAMAAVAAEDVVGRIERQRRADGRSLLADGEMRGPSIGEGDVLIAALGLEGAEHRLELADDHHVAEDLDQRLLAARLALFGKGPRIGMQRDLREGERAGFAEVLGRDGNGLGHGCLNRNERMSV